MTDMTDPRMDPIYDKLLEAMGLMRENQANIAAVQKGMDEGRKEQKAHAEKLEEHAEETEKSLASLKADVAELRHDRRWVVRIAALVGSGAAAVAWVRTYAPGVWAWLTGATP